jgi:hypothetical protein
MRVIARRHGAFLNVELLTKEVPEVYKRPLEGPRRRLEDNIKMNLKKIGCEAED